MDKKFSVLDANEAVADVAYRLSGGNRYLPLRLHRLWVSGQIPG